MLWLIIIITRSFRLVSFREILTHIFKRHVAGVNRKVESTTGMFAESSLLPLRTAQSGLMAWEEVLDTTLPMEEVHTLETVTLCTHIMQTTGTTPLSLQITESTSRPSWIRLRMERWEDGSFGVGRLKVQLSGTSKGWLVLISFLNLWTTGYILTSAAFKFEHGMLMEAGVA